MLTTPFHRPGWVYEEKVDGWRMLAYKSRGTIRLISRSGIDHTTRFRDIAVMIMKMPSPTSSSTARWRSTGYYTAAVMDSGLKTGSSYDCRFAERFGGLNKKDRRRRSRGVAGQVPAKIFDLTDDWRWAIIAARRRRVRATAFKEEDVPTLCEAMRRTALPSS